MSDDDERVNVERGIWKEICAFGNVDVQVPSSKCTLKEKPVQQMTKTNQ